jgi:hypothetical protein
MPENFEDADFEAIEAELRENTGGTFSFSNVADVCPHCGLKLTEPGSVTANYADGFVNDNGILMESEDTNLILGDDWPDITCSRCHGNLGADACQEE